MEIDFSTVSDEQVVYELLPEGLTLLKVVDCKKDTTKNGNEMWIFTYENKEGSKVWDRLIFTPNTLNRVKKTFSNLGLDVSGKFDYQPEDTIGLYTNAYVIIEDYTDKNGVTKQKNSIDLWQSEKYQKTGKKAIKKEPEPIAEDDEIPF